MIEIKVKQIVKVRWLGDGFDAGNYRKEFESDTVKEAVKKILAFHTDKNNHFCPDPIAQPVRFLYFEGNDEIVAYDPDIIVIADRIYYGHPYRDPKNSRQITIDEIPY